MIASGDSTTEPSGIDLSDFTVVQALAAVLREVSNHGPVLFQRLTEHATRDARAPKTPGVRQRCLITVRLAARARRVPLTLTRSFQDGPR